MTLPEPIQKTGQIKENSASLNELGNMEALCFTQTSSGQICAPTPDTIIKDTRTVANNDRNLPTLYLKSRLNNTAHVVDLNGIQSFIPSLNSSFSKLRTFDISIASLYHGVCETCLLVRSESDEILSFTPALMVVKKLNIGRFR